MAYRLGSTTYANANATIKALIDGEGPDALLTMEMESAWFNLLSASGNAPDAWTPYFVSELALRVAMNTQPTERGALYTKLRDDDRLRAFEFFSNLSMTYDPAATTAAYVYHVQNNRRYVINHCVRLKPRLMPAMDAIDAAGQEILTMVWNRAGYNFRRRPVQMKITRTTFSGGTYNDTTKVISGLTGISASIPTGTAVYITGGTGATAGEYLYTASTTTSLTLTTSIGAAADGQTDIAGFYYVVSFVGIESGETFDSLASVKWYYSDTTQNTRPMIFIDPDQFAMIRAHDTTSLGRPYYFRTYLGSGSTTAWRLSPPPDADYVLRGEVLVQAPGAPSSGTSTTGFAKFAVEFQDTLRRAQLCRVLSNHGRANEEMARDVWQEIERLFPIYQDAGEGSARSGTTDVYGDYADMTLGMNYLGGTV